MFTDIPVLFHDTRSGHEGTSIVGGQRVRTSGRYVVLGVHGVGVINMSHFITTPEDLVVALDGYNETADKLGSSIRGALTIYIQDSITDTYYVLTDFLGSSTVFRFTFGQRDYVSSSLPNLMGLLKDHRLEPQKSLSYAALIASSSSGGLLESPYEGVGVLGQFQYLKFDEAGISAETYLLRDRIFEQFRGYGSDLKKLRELVLTDVLANVDAASRYPASSHISHISGGLDERVLVAAIRKSGFEYLYKMYNGGALKSESTEIALSLAGRYKYPVSRDPGYEVSLIAGSMAEDSRWRFHETSGVVRGPATPGLRTNKSVVLTPGFGNLFRSLSEFNGHKDADDNSLDANLLSFFVGNLGNRSGLNSNVLSDDLLEDLKTNIRSIVHKAKRLNVPNDAIQDYLWMATKGRYNDGEGSRSMSPYTSRFDPLYSPWLIPAAWSYARNEREKNFFQLDTIAELDRDLVTLPYNSNVKVDAYFDERPMLRRQSFQHSKSDLLPRSPSSPFLRIQSENIKITDRHKLEASHLGVPDRLVAMAESYLPRIFDLLSSIDTVVLEETFNYPILMRTLKAKPRRLADFRRIQNLHDCLAWYVE